MMWNRVYRFILLATAGGMLFEATEVSCQKQMAQTFGTSFLNALGPALAQWITNALLGNTST